MISELDFLQQEKQKEDERFMKQKDQLLMNKNINFIFLKSFEIMRDICFSHIILGDIKIDNTEDSFCKYT